MRGRTAGLIVTSSVVMALLWAGGASAATPDLDIAPTPAASIAPAAPTTTTSASDVASGVTHAQNPSVPEGAVWTEHYIPAPSPSLDGGAVELHADVLRPAHLPSAARTPVVLSMGPYFSHSGQTADEHVPFAGPSLRHRAFIDAADLFAAGYTVVLADLRGFGGSTGCLDHLGSDERADVKAVVEWAASAAWSSGRVGMYGKSYDASTGLVAMGERPRGLSAVVAQEPSWDAYSYLWSNEVPTINNRGTLRADIRTAALPGVDRTGTVDEVVIPPDTERYRANAVYEVDHPECAERLYAETLEPDPQAPVWRERDLVGPARGSDVPLFLTQGTIEPNTRPYRMTEFLDAIEGPVQAWIGPWAHVTGDDVDAQGRLAMGRPGWAAEVRAFFDAHLRDAAAPPASFAIQDNLGRWRVQDSWPGTARAVTAAVQPGRYLDDSVGAGPDTGGAAVEAPPLEPELGTALTLSTPVTRETRLTGAVPVELQTRGTGTVYVRLWDVDADGVPTLIDDGVTLASPTGTTALTLPPLDWTLTPGHALLLSVDTTNSYAWSPTPSNQEVFIDGGALNLRVQGTNDDVPSAGERAPYLDVYLDQARFALSVASVPATFSLEESAPAPAELAHSGHSPASAAALAGALAIGAGAAVALWRRRSPARPEPTA
ncbi:CocE/NonD family hydrolase [Microbacterium sp. CFBP 13617]|uniref:CocE/NonD family hydrolase n=1 Tax=Microbacterium sp. CFBP 13617 TaxID=2774035 RepID=UPI001781A47C|nr:CocE/NonD family hydrolase [Microbacterium sp. CFBP 13617]MBD8220180.1 CocE/NonD family hydrolase [Microbacterium sp. CFBP 13617]